ncbi:hypothetical protein P154DRAFT_526184 [Amniculicola lignicola CBS 123094]|uniref:Uncharacterized protein n=1 Tax=Amniculicola lignicola CBS 123094 TaxID=1392246 RepID=A0A6A5W1K9_9PLEO|nr:hypothetical protein P154DRAFT_526184 [Amniculicola lignicola CBS 123094]
MTRLSAIGGSFNALGENDMNGNAKVTLKIEGTNRKLKLREIPYESRCPHIQKPKVHKESRFISHQDKYECSTGTCYSFSTNMLDKSKCFGFDTGGTKGIIYNPNTS